MLPDPNTLDEQERVRLMNLVMIPYFASLVAAAFIGFKAAGKLNRGPWRWALLGFFLAAIPVSVLGFLKPGQESWAEDEGMGKHEIASEILSTYSVQYMLNRGEAPSREQVAEWLGKLEDLEKTELLRLGGDPEALKRFLGRKRFQE